MKALKIAGLIATLAGLVGVAFVLAPSVYGQSRSSNRELTILSGRGGELGVTILDAQSGGVEIRTVSPEGAAEKAGLKAGDVIVEFDGEHVRSARQFTRLVQETPAGRSVKATITRDGKRQDVNVTLAEGRESRVVIGPDAKFFSDDHLNWKPFNSDQLRDSLRELRELPNFDYHFGFPGLLAGGSRLGVQVNELTNQLATYFGAKDGVLVTSVTEGSAAEKAGIRAGDVITSINGQRVNSSSDLVDELRHADDAAGQGTEVTIGIVRDKKEQTLKAKIESPRRLRSARPA